MFEETIKIEIDKYEQRVLEVNKPLLDMANELNKFQNLNYTHIEKRARYEDELSQLNEYLTILNFALESNSKPDFIEKLDKIKRTGLESSKSCEKSMNKIYAKYPENEDKDSDSLTKEESDKILEDIDELQKLIYSNELSKLRYRISLFIINTYRRKDE